jgi:uncharacterized membrane protein
MNVETSQYAAKSENEQEERLVNFRLSSAIMGTMLLLLGLAMVLVIFARIFHYVREPRDINGYVDKWEAVVRGKLTVLTSSAEREAQNQQQQQPEHDFTNNRQPREREISIARPMAEVISLSSRPFAIIILLFLVGILVRIAIVIMDAGAKLMSLVVSEQGLLKKLVEQLRKSKE